MRFFRTGAPLARRVRLWGGLTLFTYVLFHLVTARLAGAGDTVTASP
jgi:hypothetical protein